MRSEKKGDESPQVVTSYSSEVLETVPSGRTIYHKVVEGSANIESEKCTGF